MKQPNDLSIGFLGLLVMGEERLGVLMDLIQNAVLSSDPIHDHGIGCSHSKKFVTIFQRFSCVALHHTSLAKRALLDVPGQLGASDNAGSGCGSGPGCWLGGETTNYVTA